MRDDGPRGGTDSSNSGSQYDPTHLQRQIDQLQMQLQLQRKKDKDEEREREDSSSTGADEILSESKKRRRKKPEKSRSSTRRCTCGECLNCLRWYKLSVEYREEAREQQLQHMAAQQERVRMEALAVTEIKKTDAARQEQGRLEAEVQLLREQLESMRERQQWQQQKFQKEVQELKKRSGKGGKGKGTWWPSSAASSSQQREGRRERMEGYVTDSEAYHSCLETEEPCPVANDQVYEPELYCSESPDFPGERLPNWPEGFYPGECSEISGNDQAHKPELCGPGISAPSGDEFMMPMLLVDADVCPELSPTEIPAEKKFAYFLHNFELDCVQGYVWQGTNLFVHWAIAINSDIFDLKFHKPKTSLFCAPSVPLSRVTTSMSSPKEPGRG